MPRHWHKWNDLGRCINQDWRKCDATRCTATVMQFRRGRPLEIQCKAAVEIESGTNDFDLLCVRCRDFRKKMEAEVA